jgi:hypothetical protein
MSFISSFNLGHENKKCLILLTVALNTITLTLTPEKTSIPLSTNKEAPTTQLYLYSDVGG